MEKKDLIKLAKIAKGGATKDLLFFQQLESISGKLGEISTLLERLLDRPEPEFDLSELKSLLEEIRDKK